MQSNRLKSLVESGGYRPKPELVACAMLRRRGVRALLAGAPIGPPPISSADRIRPAPEEPRQAA